MVLHLKMSLFTSGLTAFCVLVLHHAVVLLLLTHCCGGQFQVVGPSQPVIVTIGDDIILPCHLKPASNAAGMTFEWARPDLNPRFVHVRYDGHDLDANQNPSYKGRTSLAVNELKHGDISLKLSKVKISDGGMYKCYFPDVNKETIVQLIVGNVSSPIISLAGTDRSISGVVLQCESKGWHPEPEVVWLDGEGTLLSARPTETVRGPDGLYTVSSRVTVEKRHSSSFTCRVQQKNINQTRETQIHVSDDFFMASCSSAARVTISLVACFTSVVTVVFVLLRQSKNKTETNMFPPRDKKHLMKDIERKMAETAEESQRKEREHEDMVDKLKKQKEELKEQEKQLKQKQGEVEDDEAKLQALEKEMTDKKITREAGEIKLKQIICNYKWGLSDRCKEFEELVLITQKLLAATDGVIKITTEKKEAENRTKEE